MGGEIPAWGVGGVRGVIPTLGWGLGGCTGAVGNLGGGIPAWGRSGWASLTTSRGSLS